MNVKSLRERNKWSLVVKAVREDFTSIYASKCLKLHYVIGKITHAPSPIMKLWVLNIHPGKSTYGPGARYEHLLVCAAKNVIEQNVPFSDRLFDLTKSDIKKITPENFEVKYIGDSLTKLIRKKRDLNLPADIVCNGINLDREAIVCESVLPLEILKVCEGYRHSVYDIDPEALSQKYNLPVY